MYYVQELVREDFDRRMGFCELIEVRRNDFANSIVFFFSIISNFRNVNANAGDT